MLVTIAALIFIVITAPLWLPLLLLLFRGVGMVAAFVAAVVVVGLWISAAIAPARPAAPSAGVAVSAEAGNAETPGPGHGGRAD